MPTLTGIVWIDWLIIAAAALTAISVLYVKGFRPLYRGIRRLRSFFDKVENLFDMGKDLPPEVRDSLVATQAKLVAGHDEIVGLLAKTNERIDSHMDVEEQSLEKVFDSVVKINERLDGTADEWEARLVKHMHADEEEFAAAHLALVAGQNRLDDRLAAIEAAVTKE